MKLIKKCKLISKLRARNRHLLNLYLDMESVCQRELRMISEKNKVIDKLNIEKSDLKQTVLNLRVDIGKLRREKTQLTNKLRRFGR